MILKWMNKTKAAIVSNKPDSFQTVIDGQGIEDNLNTY